MTDLEFLLMIMDAFPECRVVSVTTHDGATEDDPYSGHRED